LSPCIVQESVLALTLLVAARTEAGWKLRWRVPEGGHPRSRQLDAINQLPYSGPWDQSRSGQEGPGQEYQNRALPESATAGGHWIETTTVPQAPSAAVLQPYLL
jgi:hypothetical protein